MILSLCPNVSQPFLLNEPPILMINIEISLIAKVGTGWDVGTEASRNGTN